LSKSRREVVICAVVLPLLIFLANFLIVRKLFSVEFTPYLFSTEGLFTTIARAVATYPFDLQWWPLWECGMPFQNSYQPMLPVAAGLYAHLTGVSPALSIHQWGSAMFCIGPVFLYLMAWIMTARPGTSFLASLAYSAISPCAWISTTIRQDLGGLWRLRRLHILAFYGEGPHTSAMALVPLAILFLYLGAGRKKFWPGIGAGLVIGAAVLFNTFGAVIVGLAGLCLLATVATESRWRYLGFLVFVGALTYAWISPLSPPSVVAAIRINSPTVDGDYRFNERSLMGVVILAVGFLILRWLLRKRGTSQLRFFILLAFLTGGIVVLEMAHMYVVPQPHRYQIAMDMMVCLSVVFAGTELLQAKPRVLWAAGVVLFLLTTAGIRYNVRYGRGLIRPIDVTSTSTYRISRWLATQFGSKRVMVPGSYSFYFNNFSDTPQVLGGADTLQINPLMRIVGYVLYSGISDQARDGQVSIIWLKALGVQAVVVPGPESGEFFKPFANPRKFEGVLPVLWREAGDTIYQVTGTSSSLAHVLPADAVVSHLPIHGLDVAETERYVKALDDPAFPEASLLWTNRHTATIDTKVQPGQAISLQVTYAPGWRAEANGSPVRVEKDGLGLIKLEPACNGRCEVTLVYDGGTEWRVTCGASLIVMAGVVLMAGFRFRKSQGAS
jgi:hypothetical protein